MRALPLMLLAAILAPALAHAQPPRDPLAAAAAAVQDGEADNALGLLEEILRTAPSNAAAHNLKCRVLFSIEQWERAAGECEQAVRLDGQNAEYHMWLGRALGERASRASFLSAFSLAKRVRNEFEEAARLAPNSGEVLADLGEFYHSAPGVVGGGEDKAGTVASRLDSIDAARAHELRARIAEDAKDYGTAEREFKQAIAAGPQPSFHWMALASYYRRRQRWDDMEAAVRTGQAAAERAGHQGSALFSGASILRATNRDFHRAVKMLEEYLAGPVKSEDAPAFVAHTWLAAFKHQLGDAPGAARDKAAALALAHDYKPAQDLKL